MRFDTKTFLEITGKGGGPIHALGTAFGMPSCLINLGAEALALLPSPVLIAIRGATANGVNRADDVIKAAFAKFRFLEGIIEYDTEDGVFRFVSDSSKYGNDRNEGERQGALANFVGALAGAAGFAGRLYNNYNSTLAQINSLKECIELYKEYTEFTGGEAAEQRARLSSMNPTAYQDFIESQFGIDKDELADAVSFKSDAENLLRRVDGILASRREDVTLEPEFTSDYSNIITSDLLKVSRPEDRKETTVFRLDYGPPKSKGGKFVLSVDGIYYDSQTSGVIPALMEIENKNKERQSDNNLWKLEHDPNLGGRGTEMTLNKFKSYVSVILDDTIIDESNFLQRFYINDVLLTSLIGQKNRRIYDLSSQIRVLEEEAASQILIANLRQVMLSDTAMFIGKINKRKKQIELAIKLPSIYGKGSLFAPGEIPVNDFNYLRGINFSLDIQKQKKLSLDQVDISGVVLPIEIKYVEKEQVNDQHLLDHLILTNVGLGDLINDDGALSGPAQLSINNKLTLDGLILLYNYLELEMESPSSTNYSLFNSSDKKNRANGQLVFDNGGNVFDLGVGIVKLEGITINSLESTTDPSALGSYVKLPDIVELQDLLHSPKGATIESWVHVPGLTDPNIGAGPYNGQVSSLYRLILANENTGIYNGISPYADINNLPYDSGSGFVNGLILGFTRDRRLTSGLPGSNDTNNNPVSSTCFFLAPTQSYDSSSVGFISRSFDESNNCYSNDGWFNMRIPVSTTVSGASFSDCGTKFCHVAVTFSPKDSTVSMYCDGQLMATSGYTEVFGTFASQHKSLNIPSIIKENSFEYNTDNMGHSLAEALKHGPSLNRFFTPWILGGGYTDGILNKGFMGTNLGGITSGLRGYLGATKFYNKPLTQEEILNNYEVHSTFFENITV